MLNRRSLLGTILATGMAPIVSKGQTAVSQDAKSSGHLALSKFDNVDPTGVGDCTGALNDALSVAAELGLTVHVGPGKYRLTAPVTVPFGVSITGESAGATLAPTGPYTQFYFDHPGKGFTTAGGSNRFRSFQTLRNQPADKPGWAPAPNDWDIYLNDVADVYFDEILLVNSTLGIIATNGGGRIWFDRIMGQPMTIGIQIDCCYDVVRLSHIHLWPYWNQGANVRAWTIANCVGFYSKRNDDCVVSDYFQLWGRNAIRIGHWTNPANNPNLPAGTSYLLKIIGAQLDICDTGYSVDSDTVGHTATLVGVDMWGTQGVNTSMNPLIELAGTNAHINATNVVLSAANGTAVKMSGSGNYLGFTDLELDVWNAAGGSLAAFVASRTNETRLGGHVQIGSGNGGPVFDSSTGGTFRSNLWLPFSPVLESQSGSIGSYKINAAVFMIDENICRFEYDISITSAGSGSGFITATFPAAPAYVPGIGTGREIALSGAQLSVTIAVGATVGQILTYNNTFPATSGARLILSGQYSV
jgi:hypothetical protein